MANFVEAFQKIDGVEVLATAVNVRDPLSRLSRIIEIKHRGDRIHAQTIDVIFVEPEEGVADKKIADFVAAEIENERAPILVLSHDEVVYGKRSLLSKMPGDEWQKFANLRMFLAWMYGHPGKKLLFMGGEFGQRNEWNHDTSLDWQLVNLPRHDGLRRLVQHLNYVYKSEPALWQLDDTYEGFDWIDLHDADNSVVSFLRKSRDGDAVAFVVNATPVVRYDYRLGVPEPGFYRELINTDAETYGGSNVGNFGGVLTQDVPWMGRQYSILIQLPPLATLAFKLDR
ncbi:MAG: hypothetical protein DMG45_00255 [Acidobacteria bacterium]|nr:MAG: hypothetical protein DMG45_00255 [Acidobacteriota bacterium]